MISITPTQPLHPFAGVVLSAILLQGCGAGSNPAEPKDTPQASVAHKELADIRSQPLHAPPTELYEVSRVVDGDTLHILRGGKIEKLRLLSVDTEEVIRGGGNLSATKPQTIFGTECAEWAKSFFTDLAGESGTTHIGLFFPSGDEARDVYGRLLCHVVLADGTDFNLLLLERGKSPYFNKYGNSHSFDAEFRAAQVAARDQSLGIWDPKTNTPLTPGAPAARRPYDTLMPWWEARAAAIESFRQKHASEPLRFVDAGEPQQLERACKERAPEPAEVVIFGAPDRVFDEDDGTQTVLFRTSDRSRALRVRIPESAKTAHAALDISTISGELRQNFVWVTGALRWSGRGYDLTSERPEQWRIADPQGQN